MSARKNPNPHWRDASLLRRPRQSGGLFEDQSTPIISARTLVSPPEVEFSDQETAYRESMLRKLFQSADKNNDGKLDLSELKSMAAKFDPDSSPKEIEEQVQTVLGRLVGDNNESILEQEWVSTLFDMFQFMTREAFDGHCNELGDSLSSPAKPKAKSNSITRMAF